MLEEVSCEKLGAVHLLWHGIFAFKVDATGERSDLVFPEPIDVSAATQRGIEGFVSCQISRPTHDDAECEMEPETIRRLRALQPGQSIVYWRGLHTDNAETPLYNELMHSIFACASELERQGLVTLSRQDRGKDYTLIEYIATGV